MDLKTRVLEGELMDAPDLDASHHHGALNGLRRVNRLSGTVQIIARAIAEHLSAGRTSTSNPGVSNSSVLAQVFQAQVFREGSVHSRYWTWRVVAAM